MSGKHLVPVDERIVDDVANANTSTQVANPVRTTIRSVVWTLIAVAAALPELLLVLQGEIGAGWFTAAVVQIIAVAGIITRIAASPVVNAFIVRFIPWLAPIPLQERRGA